jgi:signal transduction histidine kinase
MPLSTRGIRSSFAYAAAGCLVVIAVLLIQQAPGADSPAVVLLIFTASLLAAAAAWQSTRETARANALARQVAAEATRRDALLQFWTRALAGGTIEAIGRDAATLAAATLGVEYGAIFELPPRGGSLVLVTASGWSDATVEGLTISRDVDTQAGYALYANEPVIVTDTDTDRRFALPAALRSRGVRSSIAARIGTTNRPWGVVAIYGASPRTYTAADAQFVTGIAAALAGACERRRIETERAELASRDRVHRQTADLAARRAAFLAQTATVFDAALDPETTLVNLARLAVPALADCAIVDVVHEDGHARRVDVVDIDPTRRETANTIRQQPPNLRDQSPISRAIRTGQPALLAATADDDVPGDEGHERLLSQLQCQALLLVPLVARGQTLGLLTFASRERHYDGADLAVAQELAGRAAMAVDNARLYREARSASRAKDDFLAMVSHELRAPINAVLGWATMLREHRLDESRVEYAYEALERSARAQAHLLEQLLDVSRAIAGKLELRLAPAQLDTVIDAALDAVRLDAHEKNVHIESHLNRGMPTMLVDSQRLQQVFINVIANAVKFSPEGGDVHVVLRQDADAAEIVVRDDGIGIKREFLPYVFERFRQGTSSGPVNVGLGLGMSISRDIVEHHGGTITADSEGEGKGATFTVRLPVRPAEEVAMTPAEFARRGTNGSRLFENRTNP